jgi:hypothetical protein
MTDLVSRFFNFIQVDMSSAVATNIGHVLAFAIITVLHIVFGELAPKSLAIQRPIGTTMGIALPLHFFYLVFRPFIWLLNGFANFILKMLGISSVGGHEAHHSSEELQYLLDQGKESGALETNEHELIKNVFDFNERVVKNIMVPRTKISGLELDTPHKELLEVIIQEGYSRIPVYDETIDKIVGVVHAKDILPLLAEGKECILKDIIRKPYFIPETKKINDLLSELQLKRIQIAIVLDELYFKQVSYYDVKNDGIGVEKLGLTEQKIRHENFHHGFILGMLMFATNRYFVYSNKEYGLGRPDIVMIPRNKKDTAYVFEFKWDSTKGKKTLDTLVQMAMDQIKDKKYKDGLKKTHEVSDVVCIGVGFKGKELKMLSE